jgi:hypothetical protein
LGLVVLRLQPVIFVHYTGSPSILVHHKTHDKKQCLEKLGSAFSLPAQKFYLPAPSTVSVLAISSSDSVGQSPRTSYHNRAPPLS